MAGQPNPADQVRAELNATLGKFAQNQAKQQEQIQQLAQVVRQQNEQKAPPPPAGTAEKLDQDIFDEFSKSPSAYTQKVMYGAKEQAKTELREEMKKELEEVENRRSEENFFGQVWNKNRDITGMFRRAVVARYNEMPVESGTRSERINQAIKEMREELASEQANAIELREEEEAQKRLQSSPGGQAPWTNLFGKQPAQNENGQVVNPSQVTADWAKEQNEAMASRRVGAGLRR